MQTDSILKIIVSSLAVLMLSNTVAAGDSAGISKGCRDVLKGSHGANILFYSFTYDSRLSRKDDFFSKLYVTEKLSTSSSYLGLFDVDQRAKQTAVSEMGEIYGQNITFTNFTAVITGYFFPSEPGEHTFEFSFGATGAASLRIGAGGESCTGFIEKDITSNFAVKALGHPENVEAERFSTYLDQDLAYPVEIIVNNWVGDFAFMSDIIVPQGKNFMLLGQTFFQAKMTDGEIIDAVRG